MMEKVKRETFLRRIIADIVPTILHQATLILINMTRKMMYFP